MTIYMGKKNFEKIKENTIKKFGLEKTEKLINKLNIKFIEECLKCQ